MYSLKKLTAVFFLLTFAWLQYSRQLSFFHCKITNTISVQQCDCEKITAVAENKTDQSLPEQKSTAQNFADEYYTPVKAFCSLTDTIKTNCSYTVFLPSGYTFCYAINLLKPPQA